MKSSVRNMKMRLAQSVPPDWIAKALAFHQAGDLDNAEKLYAKILAVNPRHENALTLLGALHLQRRNWIEGVRLLGISLENNPEQAMAHYNRGYGLQELKRYEEALVHYEKSIALAPGHVESYDNRGSVLVELGKSEAAIASYDKAIALNPHHASAYSNRGNALHILGRFDEALVDVEKALALKPDYAEAYSVRGSVLGGLGRVHEGVQDLRQALLLNPDFQKPHSDLIFALDFLEGAGAGEQQAERRRWYVQHGRRFADRIGPFSNTVEPERKLRIGYVSADFCRHSACSIFGPVILNHDRSRFDVVCYSGVKVEDEVTRTLRAAAQEWRLTNTMSDEQLAVQIRADAIDILVDLSGHTQGNRLLVLARKPAPVQVTAWGHATGTGLATIDALFSDPVAIPQDDRHLYAEQVVNVPCLVCWSAPPDAPEVSPLPCLSGAPFTFGCLNRLQKITDQSLRAWHSILSLVPHSRLLLKCPSLEEPGTRDGMVRRLTALGIDPKRVILRGKTLQAEQMSTFHEVDIALDPFPHNGGVSTLEALHMGVPVLALLGSTLVHRLSSAILSAAGMPEWITKSEEEYVQTAVWWAHNPAALANLREALRAQVIHSPVCDIPRYTRAVEDSYRNLWRQWCAKAHAVDTADYG